MEIVSRASAGSMVSFVQEVDQDNNKAEVRKLWKVLNIFYVQPKCLEQHCFLLLCFYWLFLPSLFYFIFVLFFPFFLFDLKCHSLVSFTLSSSPLYHQLVSVLPIYFPFLSLSFELISFAFISSPVFYCTLVDFIIPLSPAFLSFAAIILTSPISFTLLLFYSLILLLSYYKCSNNTRDIKSLAKFINTI